MKRSAGMRKRMSIGYAVFGALIVIKAFEYFIGTRVRSGGWMFLAVLAVAGAWMIVYYFMHIAQLRARGRDGD
jgi:hypothetical protein